MRRYLHFLAVGLILGLFTEAQLKLVAGINPPAFLIALAAYPVILTVFYVLSRNIGESWKGDLTYYVAVGLAGLAFEWFLLGNGPQSKALQWGMFAMWTTFGFGPRVLTRPSPAIKRGARWFWLAFAVAAAVLTAGLLLAAGHGPKVVIAVFGLSGTYVLWSLWLLVLAWRSHSGSMAEQAVIH